MASVRWITLAEPHLLMHYFLFPVSLTRLALRPFTFSNGVTVPAGTLIAVPSAAVHTDGEIFPNPEEFDGFRFAKLREREWSCCGKASSSFYICRIPHFRIWTTCLVDFFVFVFASTHRSHSYSSISPGRFFAVNEVKAILAHILVTYDIKFEEGRRAPRSLIINSVRVPGKANAMFRKRQK